MLSNPTQIVSMTILVPHSGSVHFVGIDCLRGIAAFFIVGCHIGLLDRTASGIALTHFCDLNVGVFAAISGFLLFKSVVCGGEGTCADIKGILHKRIKRLLPMYVIWSLFYLAVRFGSSCLFGGGSFAQECSEGFSFWGWVVFGGGAACTLWFLINLLYVQILICLFCHIAHSLLNRVWFVALCALGMLWWSVVDSGYLGYYTARLSSFVLLGWGLALCQGSLPNGFLGWAIAAVVCLTAHFFIDFVPRFVRDFICTIPILMAAISFYGNRLTSVSRFMSSTSMGVYLWHPFFVIGIQRMIVKTVSVPYSACVILFAWVGTYVLALVTTVILGKTPLKRFQA